MLPTALNAVRPSPALLAIIDGLAATPTVANMPTPRLVAVIPNTAIRRLAASSWLCAKWYSEVSVYLGEEDSEERKD